MVKRIISDFPIEELADTLPGFHITPGYLSQYQGNLETNAAQQRLEASAEARERYWIDRTPECVNKQAPGTSQGAKKKAKRA